MDFMRQRGVPLEEQASRLRPLLPGQGRPVALDSGALALLLDKLSERCAFERTGAGLYAGVIAKYDARGGYDGGPTRSQLVEIMREERQHLHWLSTVIASLGGDPMRMSPCADVSAVASCGLLQVVSDPRTTLGDALHAVLLAELADNDGWEMLVELATQLGLVLFVPSMVAAKETEDQHLENVRTWLIAFSDARLEDGVVRERGAAAE